ncbi:MAG: TonB-dependent receptor [Geobacteraceae bacterium]|nr:TonB-dependent receptor [Geobacteraceae bacterium]
MLTSRMIMPLLVCLLTLPVISYGEQPEEISQEISSIEDLLNTEVTTVFGASKYQQELIDAPATISIVTSDDIRKGGFRSLAEVLNSVRGFYITYNRSYSFVGLRGFSPLGDYGTRLLVLVDGHRLNDAVFEQAPLGSDFPVDIDLIDRVEVIRGPGSSLYGTNALLAVINVITRTGGELKGGELSASGGSFNSWTGRVTDGVKLSNGVDLLISGSYRDSAGKQRLSFPEYVATNNGIAQGLDGENSWDLMTKVAWRDVSLLLLHQKRDKTVPTASFYSIFNDPGEKTSDRHTLAGLSYNGHGGFASLDARLTYNRYEYDGDYPLDNSGQRTLNRDVSIAEWIGSDLYASKLFGSHLLTVGMEHRWQFTELQRNFDVTPTASTILDNNHHTVVQGYYLQDEYHLLDNLILNAGLRFDYYNNFGGTTNPRAALIWKPQKFTVLRFSYGEAFRAPNAYEQYYSDQSSIKGNLNLKPEKIRTVELGWQQFFGNNVNTTVTGYYTRIDDLLEQNIDPVDGMAVFKNQSPLETKGIELQAEGKWESGFSGRVSYCYQENKKQGSSQALANSPGSLVKAFLTAPLPLKKSFATLETLYSSSRLNTVNEKIAGAAIVNLTLLNRDLLDGLDLSASVYNLFDTRYAVPVGSEQTNNLSETLHSIQQDGITFRIKATYRF